MDKLIGALKEKVQAVGVRSVADDTALSRQNLHKIFSGKSSPSYAVLSRLAAALNLRIELRDREPIEQILAELASIGAPVASSPGLIRRVSPNSILIAAINRGREDATVNTILPITLFRNRKKIDWNLLLESVDTRYLGYLLENVFEITKDSEIQATLLLCLAPPAERALEPLDLSLPPSARRLENMKRRGNKIAAKWGYLTLDSQDGVTSRFLKWAKDADV
jgi:transcriptional regulator with XRE-family HTH domain